MTERRYTDEETAAIFRVAAEHPEAGLSRTAGLDGLTLGELQAIGHEVGLSRVAIERAAHVLEVRESAVSRRLLGLPVGVERQVKLARRLSDEEWERLVVQLREVFGARGTTKSDGSLRQWTNGNLYVLDEPTPDGRRLRLGSVHGGASQSIKFGLAVLAGGLILGVASLFGADASAVPMLLGGGSVMAAIGVLRVPRWARLRGRQMEDLAVQLTLPPEPTASVSQVSAGSTARPD
jgi:hypothetical protein